MAALRTIAYMLIHINGDKEDDWHLSVFHEYDSKYRRTHEKYTHGRMMKIFLAVMAEQATEWEKARRMLRHPVFRCLADIGQVPGL
eukprot:2068862-Pleurochrysis_carterae.AAC.1